MEKKPDNEGDGILIATASFGEINTGSIGSERIDIR